LFGVSMGAAAALLAAAEYPEVTTVVADSSFLSLEHTVTHHLKMFWGLPRFPLGDELLFFIETLAGFRSEDLDLEKAVARISTTPLLFLAGTRDRRMPIEAQRRLYAAAKSPLSRFVTVEGASHGAAYRTDPELYEKVLLEFLEGAVKPSEL
jgi:pimeloyl-ACP methyl ester carboxylesterase